MSVSKFCCCQLVGFPSAFLFALRSRCLSLLVALHQINLVTVYHSSSVQNNLSVGYRSSSFLTLHFSSRFRFFSCLFDTMGRSVTLSTETETTSSAIVIRPRMLFENKFSYAWTGTDERLLAGIRLCCLQIDL